MSYIDRKQDPRRRANAIVAVAAIHAVLAYAVVTGLGAKIIDRLDPPPLVGTPIPLPPPPPKPTPPKPTDPVIQTRVAPLPPIPLPPLQGPAPEFIENTKVVAGVATDPYPPLPTPQPAPSFTPKRAVPRNSTSGWISNNDYPRQPLISGVEGSVGYRLVIGTSGRVSSCELTRPSGNRALDDTTCRLITSRARFEPATDETGAKVLGTFTGSVRWEIPE